MAGLGQRFDWLAGTSAAACLRSTPGPLTGVGGNPLLSSFMHNQPVEAGMPHMQMMTPPSPAVFAHPIKGLPQAPPMGFPNTSVSVSPPLNVGLVTPAPALPAPTHKPNPVINSLHLQQAINILSEQAQLNQASKLPYLALNALIASGNHTQSGLNNHALLNGKSVLDFAAHSRVPVTTVDSAESTDATTDGNSKVSDESGSDGDAHAVSSPAESKGERRSKSWKIMLTAEQAVVIYKERPTGSSRGTGASVSVGKKFGVSAKTIRDIWNRETWVKATRDFWTKEEEEHYERAHKTEEPEASSGEPGSVASLLAAGAGGEVVGQKRSRGRPKGVKDSRPRKCRHPSSA